MKKYVFHLIPNAHLDPVWLWDWREGLTEGLITCGTILDLMDEYPDITFTRGEAAIYEHIEKTDAETFKRICGMIEQGRWEIVGGTMVQPDTNMPGTETLCRQFDLGQEYFMSRFGKRPKTAWAADSFGHSAGLPEIFAASGVRNYAFTRPDNKIMPMRKNVFWWRGRSGAKILCLRPVSGWYGCERNEMIPRLDGILKCAEDQGLKNTAALFGLGNHGGGPTRRHIREIKQWAGEHAEIEVKYSSLHAFFESIRTELAEKGEDFIPEWNSEMNFCLRGCYSSAAKFKSAYRKAEALTARAEKTASIAAAAGLIARQSFNDEWRGICFNSFHDILPGSSIERANEEQTAWLGHITQSAAEKEFAALSALSGGIDTSRSAPQPGNDMQMTVPFIVWNPHPQPFSGTVEFETSLDYRPIFEYLDKASDLPVELRDFEAKPVAFQIMPNESDFFNNVPWRKRFAFHADVPPMGWIVMEAGWVENARSACVKSNVSAISGRSIGNGIFTVECEPDAEWVNLLRNGKSVFNDKGLGLITVDDPWGAWGGMAEEPESLDLSNVKCVWRVEHTAILATGPERAILAAKMRGGDSSADIRFILDRDRDAVDIELRLLWNERFSRLKIVLQAGDNAVYEVPGGAVERAPSGEVPGGRWVVIKSGKKSLGFISDSIYSFSSGNGSFFATACRASQYASDEKADNARNFWRPVFDRGELKFRFCLSGIVSDMPAAAFIFEQGISAFAVPAKKGFLPRKGSFFWLKNKNIQVLSIRYLDNVFSGWIVRLQETSGINSEIKLNWFGQNMTPGSVPPYSISSWLFTMSDGFWICDTYEPLEKPRFFLN